MKSQKESILIEDGFATIELKTKTKKTEIIFLKGIRFLTPKNDIEVKFKLYKRYNGFGSNWILEKNNRGCLKITTGEIFMYNSRIDKKEEDLIRKLWIKVRGSFK